jgi:hypothetical protein
MMNKSLVVYHIPFVDQLADILIKTLSTQRLATHRENPGSVGLFCHGVSTLNYEVGIREFEITVFYCKLHCSLFPLYSHRLFLL